MGQLENKKKKEQIALTSSIYLMLLTGPVFTAVVSFYPHEIHTGRRYCYYCPHFKDQDLEAVGS